MSEIDTDDVTTDDEDVAGDGIEEEEFRIVSINWLIHVRIKLDHKTEHKLVDHSRIIKG